MMDIETVRNM